jgi:nucleoside-diphosphate-sugar epimerase
LKGRKMSVSSDQSRLHVVLGAGPVGRTIAATLLRQGAKVRLVSRSGKVADAPVGLDIRAADLNRPEQASAAIEDAAVVYHCAAPAYQN